MGRPTRSGAVCLLVSLCAIFLRPALLGESKKEEAAHLISNVKRLSDIRAEGSPAFQLKAKVQLFGMNGTAAEGTYLEDWNSPEVWRTEIEASGFSQIEVAKNRTVSIMSTLPLLTDFISPRITALHEHLVAFHLDGNWLLEDEWRPSKITDQEAGSMSLRCIDVESPFSWQGALCFDRNTGLIAAKSTTKKDAPYGCTYANYQKFGDKWFPRTIECYREGRPALEATVVELVKQTAPDSLFADPPGARDLSYCPHEGFPAKVVSADIMSFHLPASVGVSFIVGADSKPRDPHVTHSGGAAADKSALRGLDHWGFKAATCDGKAVTSEMEIVIPAGLAAHGADMAVPVPATAY